MIAIRDAVLRLGLELLRPELGGPDPALTPGATGGGAGAAAGPGSDVVAAVVPSLGPNLGAATLILVGVAAVIGFVRGARREAVTLAIASLAAVIVGWMWPLLATTINRVWRLFYIAVIRQGIATDDISSLWTETSGMTPLLPVTDNVSAWQIGFFVFGVLIVGYGGARFVAGAPPRGGKGTMLPLLLERLVGSMVGAATGYLVSQFVLPRLVPEAEIAMVGPGTAIYERLSPFGPYIAFATIVVLIVFGVTSIRSNRPRQRSFS